ncbi:formate C-acetyltransferase [Acetivibrio saccincola]|jgi:formate C-acetyltransferase|uniref:Formate acetyltransferase n=1 Tax=Acetivibrio saccincola TaxID=1677857 RepID=A0A2K9E9R7_9FIRM|nr:formate C-acetyltransferase [Acetivibrio saccincola]AUG58386.1 Formate acetyltransferase [Acetivibrio saccincola]NLW27065.1 formate C-acetyltransferase [Acetivibrio saccincola]PQQ66403.1 formate C-acetyltransferase [Acetivibrio saccincola]
MTERAWRNFTPGIWQENIDVRDFIVKNYTPYEGDESFLASPSIKTEKLWDKCKELLKEEHSKGGVLNVDIHTVSGITSHPPGYIDEENELIKGLQTDSPLKRAVIPFGGIRMAKQACERYGYKLSPEIDEVFNKFRKTHNEGVFSAYTKEMRLARRCGVITGLPDAYGRGRIIGDYRRVALYGVTKLINKKQEDLDRLLDMDMTEETIRLREEVSEQIKALNELVQMAKEYGCDIRRPAQNALEAIQWTYFAFLGALKETNGAANSLGRVSTFFDIYIERDLKEGILSETEAQELIDQFVIKLRMIRHLRTPEYNELFAGDPVWITESIAGMCEDGRHMVTKTSFRFLQTLFNLGPAPEPNITILWSHRLPENFKKFCAKVSMETSSIQYENDDIMRTGFGDDYSISCCVSAMRTGKDMQFFGARCNLPKLLLLALNGGRDEITGEQVAPEMEPYPDEYLDYNKVMNRFRHMQKWLAKLYVNTMNIIHYMHDKYAYERLMMALHDTEVQRFMAFGLGGLSVLVDSLSAIKYTYVKAIRDEKGLITDFEIKGDYPQFGNDDDRVDNIAVSVVRDFYTELKKCPTYRNSKHTLSILTITSNVVYGEKTGATPDGRKKGEPFAPGANPMHGRDKLGALAALNSVAKIPYEYCKDGISLTTTLVPGSLGKDTDSRIKNLAAILDGYFAQRGHHININVLEKAVLERAMKEPENYPQLTIRVSGYAVNFIKLTPKQQSEVIARTFHRAM